MTTGLIICGALGKEVHDLIQTHAWDAEIIGVSAADHLFPERISPDVEKRILALRNQYERLIVVFGDCGSKDALDKTLARYGIERIAGPHCYEMYGGATFHELLETEQGTYFLTDFMVRTFQGLILKGMGLDRFPQLIEDYFKNYRRVVYLAQKEDEVLLDKAERIASDLGLPLEVRITGYNLLEERLIALMGGNS